MDPGKVDDEDGFWSRRPEQVTLSRVLSTLATTDTSENSSSKSHVNVNKREITYSV